MTWWLGILQTVIGGGLFFAGVWVGSRIAKGEPILPKKPAPLPMPIYDTPAERNAIRKAAREEQEGITYEVVP